MSVRPELCLIGANGNISWGYSQSACFRRPPTAVYGLGDMRFQEAHEFPFLTPCAPGGFGETAAQVSMFSGDVGGIG